jgi:hypothetical protein
MKKVFIFFIFSCFVMSSIAQDASMQNVIPPSPEASAVIKRGTYPVGTFTGRPDITIPVYEIKTRRFSIPISFSYDATGIRVDDISTWVGMNWSMSAGGMITRNVVSLPDDEGGGYYTTPTPRFSDITNTPYYIDYLRKVFIDLPNTITPYDRGPDRFSYSFNGRSGSFAFKSDHSIMQIPETSLKIQFENIAFHNNRFTITDENGTRYLFREMEFTNIYTTFEFNAGSNSKDIITGWYLNEMISADSTEHVYFNYQVEPSGTYKTNNFTESYGPNKTNWGVLEHLSWWDGMERRTGAKRLESIVFTGGKVTFTKVADRVDDLGSRLDEITVYSSPDAINYTKIKSYKLRQGYYYSSGDYTNVAVSSFTPDNRDRYRMRLDTILLKDATGNIISNYSFTYNSTMLPPKTSCAQDWWGYYNGTGNHTLVPPTTTFDGIAIGGANRNCNEAFMNAGTLEKIIYPTKGYTQFDMEAHKYVSNQRVKAIGGVGGTVYGLEGLTHTQTFSFVTPGSADLVSGTGSIIIYITPYSSSGYPNYTDPVNQFNSITAPQVKIKNLNTGVETVYTSANGGSNHYSATINYVLDASTTYEVTEQCYKNGSGIQVTVSAIYERWTQQQQTLTAGGLRVKAIKNFDSDARLVNQENYKYGQNENGLGAYAGLEVYKNTIFSDINMNHPGAQYPNIPVTLQYTYYQSSYVFDQTLFQGSPVAYNYVTKYNGTSDNNAGKTIYHYDDPPYVIVNPLPSGMSEANNMGVLVINDEWKKGKLLSQQDFKRKSDGTYEPVLKVTNTYNTQNTTATYGLMGKALIYEASGYESNYDLNHFAYAEYPINTGYAQLSQTVKDEYVDNTNKLTTTTTYTYDNNHHDFTSAVSFTNSKGELMEISKKYPFNKTDFQASGTLTTPESSAIDNMISSNIISPVLEEITKRAGVQVQRKRSQFELVNSSTIAPVTVKFQTGSNPLETRLFFTKYDAFGNLTEQQKANDKKVCYIWDYLAINPIAEIENASQDVVAYTSFEADGLGGWTQSPGGTLDNTKSVTGKKSFGGTLTKTVPSGNYTVTLWSNTGGSESVNGSAGTVLVTKGLYTLKEWKLNSVTSVSVTGTNIDEVRLYPQTSLMKTYTYDLLVGITSSCDINNVITFYEYDTYGRVKLLRDQDGNIIRTMNYHYKQ